MYNKLQLASRYLQYFTRASNGKGHGIHSPFVFDFITHILNDKRDFYCYSSIEAIRTQLLNTPDTIEVKDYGAGSSATQSGQRSIQTIARWSLKSKKYAQLLFRMVHYYQPAFIIELGTSLGITTSYLASANPDATVHSFEGAPAVAAIAQNTFSKLHLKNIQLTEGNFDQTLPGFLKAKPIADFIFIDGNHRKEPTVRYFHWLLPHITGKSIIVFDDIHWSTEMDAAWKEIIQHEAVTYSIDLFFIGIVFFNKDFKVKQDFVIRY